MIVILILYNKTIAIGDHILLITTATLIGCRCVSVRACVWVKKALSNRTFVSN